MFINKLGLKNFKCFKEVEVSFGKITLLTGENSSGKSSLIYGLLAAFQSERFPLYLFPNGKYVNMGDFNEISFKHNKENKIEIKIDFNDVKILTQWVLNPINELPKLYYLNIDPSHSNFNDVIELSLVNLNENKYICNIKDKIENFEIDGLDKIVHQPFKNKDQFTEEMKAINMIEGCVESIDFIEIQEGSVFNFIGSYRDNPKRTYYQQPKSRDQVLTSGEGFIDQILEWKETNDQRFNYLVTILRDLDLLYDIKPEKIGGGRFDLRVKVKEHSNWNSLADVGFGVSQLLPILVADLQMMNNSTMIIAQPEIHLHPSIQAKLGNYFVENVNFSNMQYIIETHSEYLINRLRLSIVKGKIKPDEVAVYYFENTENNGSITHKIEFTRQGEILNAPQGFFDTYMIDTMDIAMNA